jgi:hypothetical protein
MSIRISNLATPKQVAMLQKLEYYGRGKYAVDRLSVADAAELITELFEEERLLRNELEGERYDESNS